MAAYVIAEISVNDPDVYDRYKAAAPPSVAAFDGAYRVRGGAVTPLEGDAPTGRVVVLEFPDVATAQAWYGSDAYQAVLPFRLASADCRAFIVDGAPPT
jgi:uncharacterized protein (DUF1330 family)